MAAAPSSGDDPTTAASPAARLRAAGPLVPLVAAWAALAFTLGPALANAWADNSAPVRLVGTVAFWTVWVVGLVALLVPHPISLTVLRLSAPTAVAAAVWAAVTTDDGRALAIGALVVAVAAAALALLPTIADRCVDGSSYGPEQRLALKVPLPLLLGPLPLAWAVTVLGVLTGPFLLAAQRWVVGAVVVVVGWPAAVAAVRSVHGLSERFVVFVPAGFVLHDRAVLFDPVLFARHRLARIGPAEITTTATDLTMRATGLVVEVELAETVEASLRAGRREATTTDVRAFLICPVRPGAFLRAAAAHRLPVG